MDTTNHNKGQGIQEGSELQEDGKGLEGINDEMDYIFKDAKIVNGLPQIKMSELIKRTKELGFKDATQSEGS